MSSDEDGDERGDALLLDLLGDGDCRRLVRLLHDEGPLSVRELHDQTEIAESTLYRKMNRMSDTALVSAETHPVTDGRQPTVYRLVAEGVGIEIGDRLTVETEPEAADGSSVVR